MMNFKLVLRLCVFRENIYLKNIASLNLYIYLFCFSLKRIKLLTKTSTLSPVFSKNGSKSSKIQLIIYYDVYLVNLQ